MFENIITEQYKSLIETNLMPTHQSVNVYQTKNKKAKLIWSEGL